MLIFFTVYRFLANAECSLIQTWRQNVPVPALPLTNKVGVGGWDGMLAVQTSNLAASRESEISCDAFLLHCAFQCSHPVLTAGTKYRSRTARQSLSVAMFKLLCLFVYLKTKRVMLLQDIEQCDYSDNSARVIQTAQWHTWKQRSFRAPSLPGRLKKRWHSVASELLYAAFKSKWLKLVWREMLLKVQSFKLY